MSIVLLKIWQSENKSIYYELSKKYNVPVKHVYKLVHGKKVKIKNEFLFGAVRAEKQKYNSKFCINQSI